MEHGLGFFNGWFSILLPGLSGLRVRVCRLLLVYSHAEFQQDVANCCGILSIHAVLLGPKCTPNSAESDRGASILRKGSEGL